MIVDDDIIQRLRGIERVEMKSLGMNIYGAVPGNGIRLCRNDGDYSISFNTPSPLIRACNVTPEIEIWIPRFVRQLQQFLFMIAPAASLGRPFFSNRKLIIPIPYATANVDKEIDSVSFSQNSTTDFRRGRMKVFFTREKYPLTFGMKYSGRQLQTAKMNRMSDLVSECGLRLRDFKFVKQIGEELYFAKNL